MLKKILDRQECAKNIIIFNIPKVIQNTEVNKSDGILGNDKNSIDENNSDLSKVNNIIDEMFFDNIDSNESSILKASRIRGKKKYR